jgi:hypothetical protein
MVAAIVVVVLWVVVAAYRTQSSMAKKMAHRGRRTADPAYWLYGYVSGRLVRERKVRDQGAKNGSQCVR